VCKHFRAFFGRGRGGRDFLEVITELVRFCYESSFGIDGWKMETCIMIGRSCIIEKKRKKDGILWVLMISLIHSWKLQELK